VRGRTVVLATGSRPRTPPVPAWTSDDVFRLERAPESIAIVGGGYIGCELAHFFHGIGTETTLLNRSGTLLPNEDEEVRAVFQAGFTARIPTRLNAEVSAVEGRRIRLADGATLEAEAVLFAIGRVPNTDGIGIERTMIRLTETGHVRVDEFLGTGMEGVHAMGDVVGRHPFTHAASWEAQYLAGRIVHGRTEPLDYGPVPHAVFSHPQVAGVGATEQELRARGTAHLKASVPYRSAAKGRAVKEEHGLCKFLLDPLGKILGCHIVGHEASTLLHEVIPVMKWRNHISSLTEIIHVHPSLPEVIRNAARKARDLVPRRE
jgi:dihydrolipoamide dehydrogenase